jgi:hypothetical protein
MEVAPGEIGGKVSNAVRPSDTKDQTDYPSEAKKPNIYSVHGPRNPFVAKIVKIDSEHLCA